MPQTHIKSAADLITSHTATRDGFSEQALVKAITARPYVDQALIFWAALQKTSDIKSLLKVTSLRNELLAAAGFSEKAQKYFTPEELSSALNKVLDEIHAQTGASFREHIFYRNLLTKGDTLGGQMRNITGATAQKKFVSILMKGLEQKGFKAEVKKANGSEGKVQKIKWRNRVLLFDVTPRKLINKNIDVILLQTNQGRLEKPEKELLSERSNYLACGELKGGIDPAGADEHWKTAKSALDRIRIAFEGIACPPLFFVAAAIEAAQAEEIYNDLKTGKLTHAANLTNQKQVYDLVLWITSL